MMKKKIGVAVALLAAVVAVVVLVRTALFTSMQMKAQTPPEILIDAEKAASRLAGAIRFKTISHQDPAKFDGKEFLALHTYLETSFPKLHAALKKETVNGYSLLYTWKGSDPGATPVLLMGHLDVVPVEPGTEGAWNYGPFSGDIAEGFIWGRGSLDIKVVVTGAMEAVEYLLGKGFAPRRTIYLAFGHDEEIGGRGGAMKIAALLTSRGVQFEYVLDEGGSITDGVIAGVSAPVALVGIAEKGYLSLELSATGEGGHSSMPPRETTAGIVCTAVSRLQDTPFSSKFGGVVTQMFRYIGPEMSCGNRIVLSNMWLFGGILKSQLAKSSAMAAVMHTTIAPTMLDGSVKDNILPEKATAVVNFRILPGENSTSVIEHVKKAIDDPRVSIQPLGYVDEPSSVSDIDSWAFNSLQTVISQLFPRVVVSPYLVLGITDSRNYASISRQVLRFTPTLLKADDLARIHGTNERISVLNYEQCVKFFAQLIMSSNG